MPKTFADSIDSQRLGHIVAQSAPVMVWIADAEKRYVYFNDAWLRFSGKTLEQEFSQEWENRIHPDDLDNFKLAFVSAFNKRQNFKLDYRLLNASGSYFWIRNEGSPCFDEEGEFEGYIACCYDFHEEMLTRQALEESHTDYRETIDGLMVGVVVHGPDSSIILNNTEASLLLGLTKEQMRGKEATDPNWQFVYENLKPVSVNEYPISIILATHKPLEGLVLGIIHPQRNYITWVDVYGKPTKDRDGNIQKVIINFIDITQKKKTENELRDSKAKLLMHIENTPMGCITWDPDFKCTEWNKAAENIFGYTADEVIGKRPTENILRNEVWDGADEVWEQLKNSEGGFHSINQNISKEGEIIYCDWYNTPLFDEKDELVGVASLVLDVTEQRKLTKKLKHQANHDNLTGLLGRTGFEQKIKQTISLTSVENEHALCFLDLDQFKVINDTRGHTAGDELLRQLAKLLHDSVREGDVVARLGGDEFGILLENCPLEKASEITQGILEKIKDFQFSWEQQTFRIGASIGLVAITHYSGNVTNLFKQADAACYMAKDLGRNRIHVFHPDDVELAIRYGEMQWVGRIHAAIEQNSFCLFAQPIMNFSSHEVSHYELLIRLEDEDGTLIPPGSFLPAAERYDLMEKIDFWVLDEFCRILESHEAFFQSINFVTINLSGQTINNGLFLERMISKVDSGEIQPQKVCFEITETVAISNLNSAVNFIDKLKAKGFRFALDDFGSGASSFAYLKNLPVDYLKIDGIFVKDIVDDPIDFALVKSINEVGHIMNMKTIAEFVENESIAQMLTSIGVDYGQGYGLGKPIDFAELIQLKQ